MIEIALRNGSAQSHQRFAMRLENNFLDFEVNYLSYLDEPVWTLDIYRDGTPLVLGAWLVPGAELNAAYPPGIGRFIFVGDKPDIDNLGVANHLVWVPS